MSGDALTAEKMMAYWNALPRVPVSPRIVFTPTALRATAERLFPASKNRSARIRKKLIKRFGGEFRIQPAMWQVDDVIYAHPALREQILAQLKRGKDRMVEAALFRGALVRS
jgi:hypothetical protein